MWVGGKLFNLVARHSPGSLVTGGCTRVGVGERENNVYVCAVQCSQFKIYADIYLNIYECMTLCLIGAQGWDDWTGTSRLAGHRENPVEGQDCVGHAKKPSGFVRARESGSELGQNTLDGYVSFLRE